MSTRKSISLKTKLAAALCQMLRVNDKGELERVIDHESAKKMTPEQILSIWQWDHYPIAKWLDGPDEPWNLVPMPIMPHREKTAKYDTPNSAKADRVTEAQEASRRKMLAKIGQGEPEPNAEKPKRRWKPEGAKFDWSKGRYVMETE